MSQTLVHVRQVTGQQGKGRGAFYPEIPLIFQDTSLHKYTRYLIMIYEHHIDN